MGNEIWWNIGLSVVIAALQSAIKDAKKRASIKKAMLKIATLIQAAYANDPDFDPEAVAPKAQAARAEYGGKA